MASAWRLGARVVCSSQITPTYKVKGFAMSKPFYFINHLQTIFKRIYKMWYYETTSIKNNIFKLE